jgi:hypothetical protein
VNIELTLIGKPGCHLCDDARDVITRVLNAFRADYPNSFVVLTELSILDDVELAAAHMDEIPVLKINGRVHNFWRIDPDRFRSALEELVD